MDFSLPIRNIQYLNSYSIFYQEFKRIKLNGIEESGDLDLFVKVVLDRSLSISMDKGTLLNVHGRNKLALKIRMSN